MRDECGKHIRHLGYSLSRLGFSIASTVLPFCLSSCLLLPRSRGQSFPVSCAKHSSLPFTAVIWLVQAPIPQRLTGRKSTAPCPTTHQSERQEHRVPRVGKVHREMRAHKGPLDPKDRKVLKALKEPQVASLRLDFCSTWPLFLCLLFLFFCLAARKHLSVAFDLCYSLPQPRPVLGCGRCLLVIHKPDERPCACRCSRSSRRARRAGCTGCPGRGGSTGCTGYPRRAGGCTLHRSPYWGRACFHITHTRFSDLVSATVVDKLSSHITWMIGRRSEQRNQRGDLNSQT